MVPIVLHHGIFNLLRFQIGRFKVSSFSGGIEEAIAGRGHRLVVARVHPTAGIARRAAELKESILRQLGEMGLPNAEMIIIAHSMGGLDARYMISRLDMASRVRALVTISTPHRGSPYADFCQRHLCDRLGGFGLAQWLGMDIGAVNDLTTESCRKFNETVLDSPLVRYFSIAGARPWNKVPAFALHSWRVIHQIEGANDCLVSVKSAHWGQYLGTWPLDHFHQINKRFVIERKGEGNVKRYYLRILDDLRNAGVNMDDPR